MKAVKFLVGTNFVCIYVSRDCWKNTRDTKLFLQKPEIQLFLQKVISNNLRLSPLEPCSYYIFNYGTLSVINETSIYISGPEFSSETMHIQIILNFFMCSFSSLWS